MKSQSGIRICWLSLLLLGSAAAANDWQFEDVSRIVAISDIHGAYDPMVETLGNAGIIDDALAWSGGDSHLVVVGDILDRGADSRQAMDLLLELEGQALAAGGRVHVLIGNHEAMNLVGDLRYVSSGEYAAFADEEPAELRERWFAAYAARQGGGSPDELRGEFEQQYPPGYFAHRQAFSADGEYGAWLATKPVVVVINGTAFVHGGLSPVIAEHGLDGVNEMARDELGEYLRDLEILYKAGALLPTDAYYAHGRILDDWLAATAAGDELRTVIESIGKLGESDLHASDGPLWYRGNAACCRVVEQARLGATLDAIGARRVVIGHTPTQGRQVLERFDGRVLEVDTGMLNDYYGGSGNALVIDGERVFVVGQDSREALAVQPHPRQVGTRPGGFLSDRDTETLLSSGEISRQREDDSGRTIVTLSDGRHTIDAVFTKRAGRDNYPDLAAYRLDRLLQLDMVPVTVRRSIDGDDGSLQFLPVNLMDEQQRAAGGRGGSAMCPLPDQWSAMYVFDALIYNEGRSQSRISYDTGNWQLILTGHDRAFGTGKGRPRHLESVELVVGAGWQDALAALGDEVVEAEFADVLDKRRRRALAARRDTLLGK